MVNKAERLCVCVHTLGFKHYPLKARLSDHLQQPASFLSPNMPQTFLLNPYSFLNIEIRINHPNNCFYWSPSQKNV